MTAILHILAIIGAVMVVATLLSLAPAVVGRRRAEGSVRRHRDAA
jgi:hypothetical protein